MEGVELLEKLQILCAKLRPLSMGDSNMLSKREKKLLKNMRDYIKKGDDMATILSKINIHRCEG